MEDFSAIIRMRILVNVIGNIMKNTDKGSTYRYIQMPPFVMVNGKMECVKVKGIALMGTAMFI